MKVIDIINGQKRALSFEVFPPKTAQVYDSTLAAAESVAALSPSYMSVTYGAGGGTSGYTVDVARALQARGVPTVAHLSCISSSREEVRTQIAAIRGAGLENVLALRGDLPEGGARGVFSHACELLPELKAAGDFCIGGACYPEVHPESASQREELRFLKEKVDAGCDYLVTQLFFDNDIFYNFLCKCRAAGINVPIVPGIMPITGAKQLARIAKLSGQNVPPRMRYLADRFGGDPAAMRQAGIAYATQQVVDLYANGLNAVHLYAMNNAAVVGAIQSNVSELLK